MQVLVFASRKGGSGKTTLAGHLAVQAERSGAGPVALLDIDPQGSLADWWNARAADTPRFVKTSLPRLEKDLQALQDSGIGLLVVDTPPALNKSVEQVVGRADLVVIPTRPSPHDLRSIGATVEMVEHLGKPLVFVLNSATQRAKITAESIALLSEHGTLAPAIMHHRVDYASSMIDGRTVMELGGATKAKEEIAMLWDYLSRRMGGAVARPNLARLVRQGKGQGMAVETVAADRIAGPLVS